MTEIQKQLLEKGIVVAILAGLVWYQTEQLKDQKTELRAEIKFVSDRLNLCELDRLDLSKKVAQMSASLEILTPDLKSGKKRK